MSTTPECTAGRHVGRVRRIYAGAPGTGYTDYCSHCSGVINDTVRILEPWETR